jgi:Ni,Fe-hydrogenase III small subunit
LAAPGSGSTAWTTVDRAIPVTVTVPGAAEGSAQSVVPFSTAVATADPRRDSAPSGCLT